MASAVILVEQHVQRRSRSPTACAWSPAGRMTLTGTVDEVVHRVEDAFLADVLGAQPGLASA